MEKVFATVHGEKIILDDGGSGDILITIESIISDREEDFFLSRTEALALAAAITKHFEKESTQWHANIKKSLTSTIILVSIQTWFRRKTTFMFPLAMMNRNGHQ